MNIKTSLIAWCPFVGLIGAWLFLIAFMMVNNLAAKRRHEEKEANLARLIVSIERLEKHLQEVLKRLPPSG